MVTAGQRKLLVISIIFVIIAVLYYFYIYTPAQNQIKELNDKKLSLNKELTSLQELYNKAKNSKDQMEKLRAEQVDFLTKMTPEIREENVIVKLNEIIKMPAGVAPIKLKSVSFAEPQVSTLFNEKASGGKDTKNKVISMDVRITGEGKYSSFKQLLKNIVASKPKVVAPDISINSSADGGDPDTTFNLTLIFLGYNGTVNKEYFVGTNGEFDPNLYQYKPSSPKSKPNLFAPFSGMTPMSTLKAITDSLNSADKNTSSGNSEVKNDFYVNISPATYDLPGVVIGKSGDGNKALSEPKNGVLKVEFVLDYKNGSYFYKYKTEKKAFPSNYTSTEKFVPVSGNQISLLVMGDEIAKANDNVAAEVSIVNNTSLPVKVLVKNIPQSSNRLKIIKTKGIIEETWN